VFDFLAGSYNRKQKVDKSNMEHGRKLRYVRDGGDDRSLPLEMGTEINERKRLDTAARVITTKDLDHALRTLSRRCLKKHLEYMIWEVDENLDGKVDWVEFKKMYVRNATDESGLEPFELYNIVQFMTYLPSLNLNKEFKAQITEDDTMSALFARYGHDQANGRMHVERLMTKLFGNRLRADKGEGILSLDEYLRIVGVRNYARTR